MQNYPCLISYIVPEANQQPLPFVIPTTSTKDERSKKKNWLFPLSHDECRLVASSLNNICGSVSIHGYLSSRIIIICSKYELHVSKESIKYVAKPNHNGMHRVELHCRKSHLKRASSSLSSPKTGYAFFSNQAHEKVTEKEPPMPYNTRSEHSCRNQVRRRCDSFAKFSPDTCRQWDGSQRWNPRRLQDFTERVHRTHDESHVSGGRTTHSGPSISCWSNV